MAWGQFKHVVLCSCIKLSCMCVLACVSQRWEPQQCQVNTTSARRFTGNYRKQAWCKRADWTPRCSSRDPAQARRLGPDGAHTDPHKDSPHLPLPGSSGPWPAPAFPWNPRRQWVLGAGGTDVSPPAPRHPIQPPTSWKEERREREGGGVAGGHQVLSFPLFFISSLCLCVRAGVPFGPLFSPSLLSVAVSFHTHVHKRTADEHPSSNPSQAVFYRSARGTHTSTHPNTLAGCVLLPCRCLALRLLFKFSFLSEPTSMCAWMPWYHSPGPGAATFLPSFHPCQTNRRVYVLTSCSQREQHAFCLRLFLPLTFRGRLNESVSIVWKRR